MGFNSGFKGLKMFRTKMTRP